MAENLRYYHPLDVVFEISDVGALGQASTIKKDSRIQKIIRETFTVL